MNWSSAGGFDTCETKRDMISLTLNFVFEVWLTDQEKITYISILSLIILLSLAANSSLLLILIMKRNHPSQNKRNRPKTDNFIISLCVSDLLITCVVMPGNIYQTYNNNSWIISEDNYELNVLTCKLSAYIQTVASLSSIFTLTALSIER